MYKSAWEISPINPPLAVSSNNSITQITELSCRLLIIMSKKGLIERIKAKEQLKIICQALAMNRKTITTEEEQIFKDKVECSLEIPQKILIQPAWINNMEAKVWDHLPRITPFSKGQAKPIELASPTTDTHLEEILPCMEISIVLQLEVSKATTCPTWAVATYNTTKTLLACKVNWTNWEKNSKNNWSPSNEKDINILISWWHQAVLKSSTSRNFLLATHRVIVSPATIVSQLWTVWVQCPAV